VHYVAFGTRIGQFLSLLPQLCGLHIAGGEAIVPSVLLGLHESTRLLDLELLTYFKPERGVGALSLVEAFTASPALQTLQTVILRGYCSYDIQGAAVTLPKLTMLSMYYMGGANLLI
jgi:hypothetical protein